MVGVPLRALEWTPRMRPVAPVVNPPSAPTAHSPSRCPPQRQTGAGRRSIEMDVVKVGPAAFWGLLPASAPPRCNTVPFPPRHGTPGFCRPLGRPRFVPPSELSHVNRALPQGWSSPAGRGRTHAHVCRPKGGGATCFRTGHGGWRLDRGLRFRPGSLEKQWQRK